MLTNLLANAFKFTERGRVDLAITMAEPGTIPDTPELQRAGEAVAFMVSDTGIGIPLDQQAIIFEPFKQAHEGAAHGDGGTGLGLSISREIARLLGGDITVTSEAGKGSTFTVTLPRTVAEPG